MKGPFDSKQIKLSDEPLKNIKSKKSPPGGKSLARLMFFGAQRNLPMLNHGDFPLTIPSQKKKKRPVEIQSSTIEYAQALADTSRMIHLEDVPLNAPDVKGSSSPPSQSTPSWKFIGPSGATNGQTYGESRITISGRVSCIAIDPQDSEHILCGGASGGIWESFDRGKRWIPRSDHAPTLAIGSIAFDSTNPSIVYCGTGEGNGYSALGVGLLKSTNGGATWDLLTGSPFTGQGFYDLIVDPTDSNHLLAAARLGAYESKDAGVSWTRRISTTCWDVALEPLGVVVTEVFAACDTGLYKSADGGNTFTQVTLPGSPGTYSRLAVAVAKSNTGVVYVFGAGPPLIPVPGKADKMMNTPYMWRRSTKSGSFSAITLPSDFVSSQSYYNWFLAISPDDANQIYFAALEAYRGTFKNNAWSWVKISNKSGDDIHPDQHAIAIDTKLPDRIFIGNDGGLFYSSDRGIKWASLNEGLGITEIEYLAQDHGLGKWMICGTQDNGTLHYSGDILWKHIVDGDGGDCGVNLQNPDICYQTAFGMGMRRSTDKGMTWGTGIGPVVADDYDSLFYPPVEVLNDLVAQAGETIFISRDQGTTWKEKSIPDGSRGSAIALTFNKVFLATESGNIYRYTWDGSAWSKPISLTSPRNAYISDLYVDQNDVNRMWAVSTAMGGNHVFLSTDGGLNWHNRSAGLPNLPVNSIEIHPDHPDRVWVGADVGVYQSFDAGLTWTPFAKNLPNAIVSDLIYHPHARLLRAALRNRGAWEIQVDGPLTEPICATQFEGILNPNETRRWFSHSWPSTWHMVWSVMPKTIGSATPQIKWQVSVEKADAQHVTYWLTLTNLTNKSLTIEGRYAIMSYY
jgi:photosystem II stability/assembly factor-like uncharacterized protein